MLLFTSRLITDALLLGAQQQETQEKEEEEEGSSLTHPVSVVFMEQWSELSLY